jgi:hypothetical protein
MEIAVGQRPINSIRTMLESLTLLAVTAQALKRLLSF